MEVILIHVRAVVRVQLVLVQQRVQLLQAFPPCRQSLSVCCSTHWDRRTADPALVRLIRAVRERPSPFVCAACRDPEDPFLEVVPWGTWRSIVWRCVVLHVDGGHLAPLAHDLPGGCTTLLLGPRL